MSNKHIDLKLAKKFSDPEYFNEFFSIRSQEEVANGIRDLREKRGMTQGELATLCEMKQSAISRMEGSEYAGWSFNTLRRLAEALDARLSVFFEPREAVIARYQTQELARKHVRLAEGNAYSTQGAVYEVRSSTSAASKMIPIGKTHA